MDEIIKRIWTASDTATREQMDKITELYVKGTIAHFEMHDLIHRAFTEGRKHEN